MSITRLLTVWTVIVLSFVALARCDGARHVVQGRFWFDNVTFELPPSADARLGGGITAEEAQSIKAVAADELRIAFTGFRIAFSEREGAAFRIRVVQRELRAGAAGESLAMGNLGGQGSVSFPIIARHAMHYAPANADRAMIVTGVGRGIGRAAAHEFAHQLVRDLDIHAGAGAGSYEFASADRYAQCYGPIFWTTARPSLLKSLGPADAAGGSGR